MKVVFRVDASDSIASGHVTRCLTLAAALRRRGAECIFVSREVSGHLFSAVVGAGFEQRADAAIAQRDPADCADTAATSTIRPIARLRILSTRQPHAR